jgi:hypothetical protein
MELAKAKQGGGGSPLMQFTMVHGRGGEAQVRGRRSVHR